MMKKSKLFMHIVLSALWMLALACSTLSSPPGSATGTPSTIPPTSTHTTTPTATATFTPPPTYTPVYSPTPETLTSDFIAQCENAFNKNISSGTVQLPILLLVNVTYEKGGWVRSTNARYNEARSMAEAKTIMCLKEERQRVFGYSDGASAYRRSRQVRLIDTATGNVFASGSYVGDEPPSVKFQSGDTYGSFPENRIFEELGVEGDDPSTIYLDIGDGLLALSPDGKYLAHRAAGDLIQIHDLTTGEIVSEWVSQQPTVDHLEFSPDGQVLLSSSSFTEPSTLLWNFQSGEQLQKLDGGAGTFSSDGKWIVTVAYDPDTLVTAAKIWDAANGAEAQSISDMSTFPYIGRVTFSPSGETLALETLNSVVFWSVDEGQVINTIPITQGYIEGFDYSPDGSLFVIAIHHETTGFGIWDMTTGEMVNRVDPIGNPAFAPMINSISFSPDGRFLAAGLGDGTARVWETETWLEIHTFFDGLGNIDTVAFSPDGGTLYVGASTKIKFFDLMTQ